jgi:hypothetical protein
MLEVPRSTDGLELNRIETMNGRDTNDVFLKVARRLTLECVQMMGGYGYAKEYEVERAARQSIGATIYDGTNEIQREIIARTYSL